MNPSKILKLVASGAFTKFSENDWKFYSHAVRGLGEPLIYNDDENTIIIAGDYIFCFNDDGETVFELGETE